MVDAIDFQPYLDSICHHYAEWWKLYTLTDIEGKQSDRPLEKQRTPFDFGLMVRSVTKEGISQQEKSQKTERRPVLEGLRQSLAEVKHVLLIGRPGSGKSTALARLLLEEAQHFWEESSKIPVLVELRYYQTSILDLIRDFFKRHHLLLDTQQIETLLLQNHLLLLVDGLNELASEAARQDVIKLLNYRQVPMIFTTRDLSPGGDFGIEKQWEMQPLTEPQMKEFINAHLSADEANELWRQLKDRTRQLAETPLLLWMLCELFGQVQEIPRNLGEVFQVFTRSYEKSNIRKYEVAALKGDVQPLSDRRLWFPALKHLAYTLMQGETPVDFRTVMSKEEAERELKTLFSEEPYPAKTARDCLDDLLKYHLLQIQSPHEIEFHHQLFQEYYAAEWLLERLDQFTDEQLKYYFLNYLKWTEPIALMLSLVCLEAQALNVVKLALEVDLMLGARFAGEVNSAFQVQTVELINRLDVTNRFKCQLLEKTRSDAAIRQLENAFLDSYWLVRITAVEALGEIGTEKASFSMLKGLEDDERDVVYKTFTYLRRLNFKSLVPVLIRKLRRLDTYAMEKTENIIYKLIGATDVFDELNSLAESDKTIRNYVEKHQKERDWLTSIKSSVVITQEEVNQFKEARETNRELSVVDLSDIIDLIESSDFQERFLDNPDWYVRDKILEFIHYDIVAKKLEVSINSSNQEICKVSFQFVESAIRLVNKVVKDPDWRVREQAVLLIEKIMTCVYNSRANPKLTKRIERILEKTTLLLLTLSKDTNRDVRAEVMRALGSVNAKSAVITFRKALRDSEYTVRTYAARALGEIRDEQAIQTLLELLNDEFVDVRSASAYALGKISETTPSLTKYLPCLANLLITDLEKDIQILVSTIQSNCKYYNYEIVQSPSFESKKETSQIIYNITYNIPTVGNFNSGDVTIHGNQIGVQGLHLEDEQLISDRSKPSTLSNSTYSINPAEGADHDSES